MDRGEGGSPVRLPYYKPVLTTLTPEADESAKEVGHLRQRSSLEKRLRDKHGFTGDGLATHIHGVQCEIAAAKVLGLPWIPTVDTFKAPDLGDRYQVRGRTKHHWEMIVRPDDVAKLSGDQIFIHVTKRSNNESYLVHGWIELRRAQKKRWWHNHGGRPWAWFVPKEHLWAIQCLQFEIKHFGTGRAVLFQAPAKAVRRAA